MTEHGLFSFEWPVDKSGYDLELVEPKTGISILLDKMEPYYSIKRRGGPLSYYRPLDDHMGMARRLADLGAAPSPEAFRDFANKFGLLGLHLPGFPVPDPNELQQENASEWQSVAVYLHHILALKDDGELEAACELFDKYVRPTFVPRIIYERAKRPELKMVPATLLAALWFQVAGEFTSGTNFKKCRQCPDWFPVGPGTGRRETKMFCSNRCRNAWHRQQKIGNPEVVEPPAP